MTTDLPLFIYWGMAGCFSTALVLGLFKQRGLSRAAGIAGTLVSGAGVVCLMVTEQRLPLYGSLESIIYVSFLLTLLELFAAPRARAGSRNIPHLLALGIICILLTLQVRRTMAFNPDFFMYDNLWVNIFFNLRLVAVSLLSWAAVLFLAGGWSLSKSGDQDREARDRLMAGGRNFLLTGIAVYLSSEWSGSLWCLNWMGDSWQWSRGFFKSGIIFLLVMAASHLPRSLAASDRVKALLGSCPAVYILWMLFQH
ncbi:MAG: hypothetical protein GY737_27960 [Desulfobacteraceae bacterium]|nr:hypothetical protein [Desulfobacteraceae bacterium]